MRVALVRKRPVRQQLKIMGSEVSLFTAKIRDLMRAFDAAANHARQFALDSDMTGLIIEGQELESRGIEGITMRTL